MKNLEDFCKYCLSKNEEPELYAAGVTPNGKIHCSYECGSYIAGGTLCCRECKRPHCKSRQTEYGLEAEYKRKFVKALQQKLMMEKLDV